MFAERSGQVGLFDVAGLLGPLPEGSFYALLAEHGDRIVRDQDFAECYSRSMGRPSIAPSLLVKVLLLQHRTGVSDRGAMEAVEWDLRWKIALGLPVDHQGWHPTTLTKFRARLLLRGGERAVLESTLRLAGELGLLDGSVEQVVDSTPMLGAAATQDTVRLVRHGVKKLLDATAAVDEVSAGTLAGALEFDYQQPGVKPDCRWREKDQRARMLTRVAVDARRALEAIRQSDGLLENEQVAQAHRLLDELVGQDFEIDEDEVPRLRRGTAKDRIVSTVDQQMRHGRKSASQRFDGFKLSLAVTNCEVPLITAVDVAAGNVPDGARASALIDQQPPGRRPARVLGDTAYGTGPVRAELAERHVAVLAPVPGPPPVDGRVGKHDFQIDVAAGTVTCPEGHVAAITTTKSGSRATFPRTACEACPQREACCPGRTKRQLQIGEHEELLQTARLALQDLETAEHLRRTRPRVERLIGIDARRYGARKSRYIGTQKATLQAAIVAALVNLNPIGRRLATQTA